MKKMLLMAALFTATLATMAQTRVRDFKSPKEILNDRYTSGLFRNAEGTIFDIENENVQSYINILDWLQGRVAGLQVYVSRNGIRVPVIRGSAATIYVDEMRMDASFLNSLSVNDIGMIKVIKGPFVGAIGNGGGGTIAICTLRGDEEELDLNSD
ncbi:MAG TPA: TonB-dependent receptor plug domain-containing protein [Chitinophagaceae bacterium]|nr:TonB-dependent receptor plug domain-containing protein [Chitinophagaceae bacterium]